MLLLLGPCVSAITVWMCWCVAQLPSLAELTFVVRTHKKPCGNKHIFNWQVAVNLLVVFNECRITNWGYNEFISSRLDPGAQSLSVGVNLGVHKHSKLNSLCWFSANRNAKIPPQTQQQLASLQFRYCSAAEWIWLWLPGLMYECWLTLLLLHGSSYWTVLSLGIETAWEREPLGYECKLTQTIPVKRVLKLCTTSTGKVVLFFSASHAPWKKSAVKMKDGAGKWCQDLG